VLPSPSDPWASSPPSSHGKQLRATVKPGSSGRQLEPLRLNEQYVVSLVQDRAGLLPSRRGVERARDAGRRRRRVLLPPVRRVQAGRHPEPRRHGARDRILHPADPPPAWDGGVCRVRARVQARRWALPAGGSAGGRDAAPVPGGSAGVRPMAATVPAPRAGVGEPSVRGASRCGTGQRVRWQAPANPLYAAPPVAGQGDTYENV
jgi:hypothetical protein